MCDLNTFIDYRVHYFAVESNVNYCYMLSLHLEAFKSFSFRAIEMADGIFFFFQYYHTVLLKHVTASVSKSLM